MLMRWWRRQMVAGMALFAASMTVFGLSLSTTIAGSPILEQVGSTTTGIRTAYVTHVKVKRRVIRVRVPAKIIRRFDHVIVWRTARYVFVYHGHRHVIPPHVVRVVYRRPFPGSPPVAAVLGVAPPPVTVTVPETITEPVQTVVSTVVSTQLVPTTTTETSVTTLTVSVPLTVTGAS
jgi:hypothetical protein